MKKVFLFFISLFVSLSSLFAQYNTSEDKQMREVYGYYQNLVSSYKFNFKSSAEWNTAASDLETLENYFNKWKTYYLRMANSTSSMETNSQYANLANDYYQKASNCAQWKSVSISEAREFRNKGL